MIFPAPSASGSPQRGTPVPPAWLQGLVIGALVGFLARDLDVLTLVSYWGDRTLLVPLGGVFGILFWRPRAWKAVVATALGLGLIWTVLVATPLSPRLTHGLLRRDVEGRADAVFVLASRLQIDGDFTSTALARLVHGLELIGEGRTSRLILSELPPPHPSYAVPARVVMTHLGLQAELLAVGPVQNTHQEAVLVGALCRRQGWSRLLVVTSPLHARRACAALESEGLEVECSPAMETRYDLETLDRSEDRLFAFGQVLHERLGYWLYQRRGWLAPARSGGTAGPAPASVP
jgi:uncharacterized SAM-binding protein YcdF (DUF218 family)